MTVKREKILFRMNAGSCIMASSISTIHYSNFPLVCVNFNINTI